MEPIYVLFIEYDHSKCSNKIPNSIQYFQRLLDNMCPSRFVSRRIETNKVINRKFKSKRL